MVLAAGIVVPMAVEHSNKKQPLHLPTVLFTYLTFHAGLSLRGLVIEFLNPRPGPLRYFFIKILVHVCAFLLVCLSSSLSLMMRMNVVVTSLTVALAAVLVAHRLWQCAATELRRDVDAYKGCEEELQQLLELSCNVKAMLFGGWFGMAFFHFQNYPEEARHARFLPSEYLTFFTTIAASLTLLKAVPRSLAPCPRPARELKALICALVLGVVTTALLIAASKVGGYAALALVPEAIALAAWALPAKWLPSWLGYGHGGEKGEPPSHNFVSVALTLLLAVLTYRAKDGGMSSLYDEAFVLVTTADVVAALGWRMVTQWKTPAGLGVQVQAAAKILAFFTFWLLVLSVLAFLGVMFGL